MLHRTRAHRKYLCTGVSVTKFVVAVMNWTRPGHSPVIEFGNDIINPEFTVGNDLPSIQPCMSLSLLLKRTVNSADCFTARTTGAFAAMTDARRNLESARAAQMIWGLRVTDGAINTFL